ncbi:MAG: PAS domain S-box protein [Planctomycetota bacterium]|nr:PAS domain S-box protein [Planctomycetota bacterium]
MKRPSKIKGQTKAELLMQVQRLERRLARLETPDRAKRRSPRLEAPNQQSQATERQLKAANRQLAASNRQLAAGNAQLTAAERYLEIRSRLAEIFSLLPDDGMYDAVLNVVLEAMRSEYGVFGYIDENGDLVVPSLTRHVWDRCGVADKDIVFPRARWGDSSWPRAIREKRLNYTNEPSTRVPEGHIAIRRHVSLPIIHRGEVVGLLQVANKPSDYTESEVNLLERLGMAIAPILDARLKRDRSERERKKAEQRLQHANAALQGLLDATPESLFLMSPDGTVRVANKTVAARLGRSVEELVGRGIWEVLPADVVRNRRPRVEAIVRSGKQASFEDRLGDHFILNIVRPISDEHGTVKDVAVMGVDIGERKRLEHEREITVEFLRLAGGNLPVRELVGKTARFFKEHLGFEAVGIRLQTDDDYPYFEANGFPEEFVQLENSLCARTESGEVARDSAGNPVLECMCGNIICGRFDPSKPFFTPGGSFWTNCTTRLLANTTEADRQARTRNRCNGQGYESVALIPIRSGSRCSGLLQLNDRREGMFSIQLIALFERLAGYFSIALAEARAREMLCRSEEQYRSLFQNATLGIYQTTPAGRILAANPALVRMLGYDTFEALAQNNLEETGYEPDYPRGRFKAQIERDGEVRGLESAWKRRDGTRIFVRESARAVRDPSGAIAHYEGVVEDITARRLAEEEIRSLTKQIEFVLGATKTGLDIIDSDLNIRYVDPAWRKIYGETAGKKCFEYFMDRSSPCPDCGVLKALETKAPVVTEERLPREDNRPIQVTTIPFQDENGKWLAAEVNVDISERKNLEEQFRQSQKLEAVGKLAGGLAHDFNNILTALMGHCDLMKQGIGTEDPLAENLAQIEISAERAAALTRQLLAFSRRQTLQPKVLDLNALVRNLDLMLRRLIGEDIDFLTTLDGDLGCVVADPGQIEQVIANLAVNARDAMPDGGKLTIETANAELDAEYSRGHVGATPGRYVLLAVSDTGCGMDETTKSRIFEPFFTTKEKGKGTGLGLSTVYGIVKQSGGNIWVYSEPGKGATFKIYLPRTDARPEPEARSVEESPVMGHGEHILIVEDEPALQNLFERMLKSMNYRVSVAASGGEALTAVEKNGVLPDLLITDVVMPGMSGVALVERLRRTQPNLKVLYMSGYTENAIVHHGILDPGIPFIQKPFNLGALAAKINSLLRETRSGAR